MAQNLLHRETLRLRVQHSERVTNILLVAELQKRGLRKKVCNDCVSLALLARRALRMPWLLTYERICQALFHPRWSLAYESGWKPGRAPIDNPPFCLYAVRKFESRT